MLPVAAAVVDQNEEGIYYQIYKVETV